MTTLYLCRHGIAEDQSASGADADRALTEEGIKKFRKAAHGLVKLFGDEGFTHILSSPYLRARQTAEILSEALADAKRDVPVKMEKSLEPPGDLKELVRHVRGFKGAKGVVAVGHEPTMSAWVAELCFGGRGRVAFKKGAVAVIELAEAGEMRGELVALLQPGMLRKE